MIHQLAYIHKGAKLGKNVTVEPFTTISADVVIGDNSWIGPNVTIMDGARIGQNCKIFPGSVISATPQDLKFNGEYSTLEIGDNTIIREVCTLNRGTVAKEKTVIGKNSLLMAYVHVAHDCIIGNNCIIGNVAQIAGEVIVEDWAIVSGLTGVHQFVRIGQHSFISGASRVGKDVPPYTIAAHDPLSYVGINIVGLQRRKFEKDTINLIKDVYRILYQSELNYSNAVAKIETEIPKTKERDSIIEFVKGSDRGIMKRFNKMKNGVT